MGLDPPVMARPLPRHRLALLAAVAAVAIPRAAQAHPGLRLEPRDLLTWQAWSFDWAVLMPLGVVTLLYFRGVRRLWATSGAGRGLARWRVHCFAGGIVAMLVALVYPLDALGGVLFTGHMAQHVVLMLIAAPLLALGLPPIGVMWGLSPGARAVVSAVIRARIARAVWGALTLPLVVWSLHAAAMWAWHAPGAYQATLRSDGIHALQHASFFWTAMLFWWVVVRSAPAAGRRGVATMMVFTTMMHSGALGALLTFAPTVLYPEYGRTVALWGLTALEDQQLGGLIMWVPGGAVYLVAGLLLVAGWLRVVDSGPPARISATAAMSYRAADGILEYRKDPGRIIG
jgi:putative membrane protein